MKVQEIILAICGVLLALIFCLLAAAGPMVFLGGIKYEPVWVRYVSVAISMALGSTLAFFLTRRKPKLAILIVPLSLLLVSTILGGAFWGYHRWVLSDLRAHLDDYVNIKVNTEPLAEGELPPRAGLKVVLIDKAAGEIDLLQLMLPEDLRARTPGEVGCVVWLTRGESLVGTYGSSDQAGLRHTCEVVLIAPGNPPRIVAKEYLTGTAPPSTITDKEIGDKYGENTDEDVITYVKSYFHK